jgi:hypothetical protein
MKKTLIAFTILASALFSAQAGIILSDDFNYNNGPVAQPTAAAINPTSTWIANTGSGAGKEIDVTNNTLIVTGSRSEDMLNLLAGYPYNTNDTRTTALYARFTLNCQALPTVSGTYFTHFSGTNGFQNGPPNVSGFRARTWISVTNYLAPSPQPGVGQVMIGIVNSGSDVNNVGLGNTNYVFPTPLNTNTTYTIVTRYVLATGASTLWVNPTDETSTSVTDPNVLPPEPTNVAPTNGVMDISCYSFRQAFGGGTLLVDNLRVGTRFADVAGANQSPAISSIQNQAIPRNSNTGPLAFTVIDPETPANELIVTATNDNPVLIPNASGHIDLTSDVGGTNRTITVTPATGQQGSATVYVHVSDTVNDSYTTFKVTVGAPAIGAIPNQITSMSTATPTIPFAVSDTEGDTLTLTKTTSNSGLVPLGNISLGVGVPNVSSNVTVTPVAGQTGVATITISVSDGHNTTSTSFAVTVTPAPLGVVYNEDFAYPDGSLYLNSGGSGGPWHHVSPSGLDLGEIQVVGHQAYLVHTNNEDLGADFFGPAAYDGIQGYVFYTSFTVNCSYTPSNLGDYFFHLSTNGVDSSTFRDKVFANTAGAAAGKYRFGIANQAGGVVAQDPRDLITNATYAVITRYNAATGDSTLWVNPISAASPSVTASDNPGSSLIGGVALRQPGCCIGDLAIGPMKVGTAFSDVWTAPTQPHLDWMVDNSGNLVLNWSNPLFVLQAASDASGPYADVTGTAPYTNSISGAQYFRLRY